MKNLILFACMLITTVTFAQNPVDWTDIEDAQAKAASSDKPILVDVYAAWCRPCQMLSKSFDDPSVAEYVNEHFIPVKFNAEHAESITFNGKVYSNPNFDENIPNTRRNAPHELTEALGTRGYPTVYVLENETLDVAEKLVGYKPAGKLLETLKAL